MTKALAHRQTVEDSCQVNMAASDYLIPFRKVGENKNPVTHDTGFLEYFGCREIPEELHRYRGWTGKQTENRFSHWIWRNYASAIWDDIRGNQGDSKKDKGATLPFIDKKEDGDERHMHPLQLDVINRACVLWTNPGETVLTPFMGVGSEAYGAVYNGRKAVGIELKETYYRQAVRNLEKVKVREPVRDLFS
jgi:hypothetical protein